MSFGSAFDINGSAMKAQMLRLEVLSSNIANINATRTPEGGPYRRRDVVFQSKPLEGSFDEALSVATSNPRTSTGVEVISVVEDPSPFIRKFEPGHPDAGPDGYVDFPNVDVVSEMVNVQEAARSYEANIAVIVAMKSMITKAFEIGKR